LIKRLITRDNTRNHLFVSYKSQKRLTVDNLQSICFRIEKKLNLPYNIRPHKLRHTFATKFVSRNGNMEVLRILMGHTNLLTTQKYFHINSQKLRQEYERVNYLSGIRA
jgi:site-specific recombinase XerD